MVLNSRNVFFFNKCIFRYPSLLQKPIKRICDFVKPYLLHYIYLSDCVCVLITLFFNAINWHKIIMENSEVTAVNVDGQGYVGWAATGLEGSDRSFREMQLKHNHARTLNFHLHVTHHVFHSQIIFSKLMPLVNGKASFWFYYIYFYHWTAC